MTFKKIWLTFIFIFVSSISTANATLLDDSNTIFNWAEMTYPQYFSPAGQQTQTADPWYFRYYPSTGIYVGVNTQNEVYVLGGEFGNTPVFVDTVTNVLAQINSSNNTANNNPGNGNCVTLPFPSSGIQANYNVTSSEGSGSINVTYNSTNSTTAISTQTSSFAAAGMSSGSETVTTQQYQIIDDYLYVGSVETVISTTVPGFGSFQDTTTTTFSPSHNEGPALKYCEQQSWTSEAVTQTTTSQSNNIPGGTTSSSTAVVNGLVEAVNETITTPAGTFSTVRVSETESGDTATTWFSIEHGIFVKVELQNSSGAIASTTELTSLN